MNRLLKKNYGYIFEDTLIEEIEKVSTLKSVKAFTTIIDVNSSILYMPLVLSGAIKILREDKDGDELVLYYLEVGDTCTMTLSCCMGTTKSQIHAIAETDVQMLMIPKEFMSEWLRKYKSWQEFVLQSYDLRFKEFIEAIDTIAFLNMDGRLLKYLQEKAFVNDSETIQVTHQEIANDLHTSRVVVSRTLKSLENQGCIKRNRNSIRVIDFGHNN